MTTLGIQVPSLAAIDTISHRFFTRTGGTSPAPWRGLNTSVSVGDVAARVDENLARVRFQIGVGRRALFTASQVHGSVIVEVTDAHQPDDVAALSADALITTRRDIAVGVRTADCAPILLASRDGRVIAAVHAGWRGAVGGVLENCIEAFRRHDVAPRDVVAAIGPTIGQAAFEVGPEVIEAASRACDLEGLVAPGVADRLHLDLTGLVERVLKSAGVVDVTSVRRCTVSDEDFFSHRRDHGVTGRQLSVIATVRTPELDPDTFG
jgi:YfiH family protein